jgi:hypothetical protein
MALGICEIRGGFRLAMPVTVSTFRAWNGRVAEKHK